MTEDKHNAQQLEEKEQAEKQVGQAQTGQQTQQTQWRSSEELAKETEETADNLADDGTEIKKQPMFTLHPLPRPKQESRPIDTFTANVSEEEELDGIIDFKSKTIQGMKLRLSECYREVEKLTNGFREDKFQLITSFFSFQKAVGALIQSLDTGHIASVSSEGDLMTFASSARVEDNLRNAEYIFMRNLARARGEDDEDNTVGFIKLLVNENHVRAALSKKRSKD